MAKLFVYGGCVSRDTFERMKADHELVAYIARQSLISAKSNPTRNLDTASLGNKFADRVIRDDLASALFKKITEHAQETDLLVIDMLSERLGASRVYGGTFITRSIEITSSGILAQHPSRAVHIPFATNQHFEAWVDAADALVRLLKRQNLLKKTILVEAPWTDTTIEGVEVTRYLGWSADEANKMYAPYYAHMRNAGVKTITIPPEFQYSTDKHKWGASPYHYVDEAYEWLKSELEKNL